MTGSVSRSRLANFYVFLGQAPKTDSVTIVTPGINTVTVGLVRRCDGGTLAVTKAEGLDIHGNINSDFAAVGPLVFLPRRQAGIRIATVILEHFSLSRPKIDLALLHPFSRIRDCQVHLLENTLPIGGHSPARRLAPETVKKINLPQKMRKLRSAGRHAAS